MNSNPAHSLEEHFILEKFLMKHSEGTRAIKKLLARELLSVDAALKGQNIDLTSLRTSLQFAVDNL